MWCLFNILFLKKCADVPVGYVPRMLTIYCRGELTRISQPGDSVEITGVLMPKQKKFSSSYEVFMEAHQIIVQNSIHSTDGSNLITADEIKELSTGDIYEKMALSLAPEIYGHLDLKKSLILQLVGGVSKNSDGLKIRGNIHMCIVGDPGVAKSQLISYVCRVATRSQYTTGRGSTTAGLTAAVIKDPLSGELMLEGGALVLADGGICCIDEFDKMSDYDQTAIHEVMEQQTVSIAKAGIITSFNTRVSILAAANPKFGRYNSKKSLEQNIDLSAALLSRFDLVWIVRDHPDRDNDLRLANHITNVHTYDEEESTCSEFFDIRLMRRYITLCKRLNPTIPKHLGEYVVEEYIKLRRERLTFVSARKVLDIIRLSTARARLRLSDEVTKDDIVEVLRLMAAATNIDTIPKRQTNTSDLIFKIICGFAGVEKEVKICDIINCSISHGFSSEDVYKCINEYEELNVWFVNQSLTTLYFC